MSVTTPRGILKTAATRQAQRSQQHALQTVNLLEKGPHLLKVLVVGAPGVGKSAILRAAGGEGEGGGTTTTTTTSGYSPTLTPHFTTVLCDRAHKGRLVYLQLWEVPFYLLAGEAASHRQGGVGHQCSGHLDVALQGAHGVILVADAREGALEGRPLWCEYTLNNGRGPQVWQGGSLAACDLALGVLRRRLAVPGSPPPPFFLLFHKADHPAALTASLAPAVMALDAASSGGTQHNQQQQQQSAPQNTRRRMSGVVEDFFGEPSQPSSSGRERAFSMDRARSPLIPQPLLATPEALAAHIWSRASGAVPTTGFGVPYMTFMGGGSLTVEDVRKFAEKCELGGWGWSSALSQASDAPPAHLLLPSLSSPPPIPPAPRGNSSGSSSMGYRGKGGMGSSAPLPPSSKGVLSNTTRGVRAVGKPPTAPPLQSGGLGDGELKKRLDSLVPDGGGKVALLQPSASVKLVCAQVAFVLVSRSASAGAGPPPQ